MRAKGENNYFNGAIWYQQLIDKRTRAALRAQNAAFERDHAGDSDEQLLALVKARAEQLGHAPQMCEVAGAKFIAARFGSWTGVIRALGYQYSAGTRIYERSERYKAEYARQQAIYRAERREKNEARMARHRSKKEAKAAAAGEGGEKPAGGEEKGENG